MAYWISCVRSASGQLKDSRTILGIASCWRAWEITCWNSELSLHAIILSWQVYYIEPELWRHMARKNQKIAWSPHILGRLNTCANSVYQALLHFLCTPGTRLGSYALCRLIRYSCVFAAHMSPVLNGNFVLQHFERGWIIQRNNVRFLPRTATYMKTAGKIKCDFACFEAKVKSG